jgi:DNA-binding beta-propeller fold protein YncE
MRIHAATATVAGVPSLGVWAQVVSTQKAYAVIEVEHQGENEATAIGNHIAAQLVDALHDPPISLHDIETLAQDCQRQGASSLLLLIPVGNVVYLTLCGGGAVYLKRGGALARLLDGEGSVSGEISVGDTFVLLGRSIRSTLDEKQLSQAFDHLHVEELAEKLTLLLHQENQTVQGAAFLFEALDFVEEEPVVEPQEQEMQPPHSSLPGFPWRSVFSRQRLIRVARRVKSGRMPTREEFRDRFSRLDGGSRNIFLVIAVVVGILFLVSVILGIRKVAGYGLSPGARQTVTEVRRIYDEALAVQSLTPIKSREKLTEAKNLLEPVLKSVSKSSSDGRQVSVLYKQISENLTIALKKYTVTPDPFYDVSLLKKGARADSFGLSGDTLVLVDRAGQTVYAVNVETKNGQALASGNFLAGVTTADAGGETVYAYATGGIYKLPLSAKPQETPIIKADETWGTVFRLVAFGGNIYVLDTTKSRIWKYVATETSFTERREYLNPDTLPDFSKATGLAIDGSVWVGALDGKIQKFTQGKEQTFSTVGVEPPLASPLVLYTSDDSVNIYVLDSSNNRVVALDKEGVYIAQYAWEGTIKPTDIAVSEKQKKILLLSDGVVYAFDLK